MAVLHMIIKFCMRVHTAWLSFNWRAHLSPSPASHSSAEHNSILVSQNSGAAWTRGALLRCRLHTHSSLAPSLQTRIKSLLSIMSRPRRELQVTAGSFVPVPEHCCQTVKQLGKSSRRDLGECQTRQSSHSNLLALPPVPSKMRWPLVM